MNYWKQFYNNYNLVGSDDLQMNVGRTRGGRSISRESWKKTLSDIENILDVKKNKSEILELCCGNGQIIGNLTPKYKSAVGVDFSDILLKQLHENYGDSIKTFSSDIRSIKFANNSFDIIILYFSLQYFTEKEVVELILKSKDWLKKNGKIYFGDIPDERKKWNYINSSKDRKNYIYRVLDSKPLIGNWFHPDFFLAIDESMDELKVELINQPNYHFNAAYRFDILITKR